MNKIVWLPLFLFIVCFNLGCASMFNETRQAVYIDSNPKGAKIESNALHREATTPISFTFKKGEDVYVKLTKDGYGEQSEVLYKKVTPTFWLNFLWGYGFPVGMLIDWATGAMWDYQEEAYIKLEPK